MLERLKQDFKNDLIAGLLVVIPLATTIWLSTTIARWVFTFLTRVPKQINPFNDLDPLVGNLLNLLIGLAVPLLIIMFIGLMARNIAGQWLLDLGERTLQAIPFAGSLYKTLKQLLETLFRDTQDRFRRVVLLEYPRKGVWAIAFVTGAVGSAFQDHLETPMLSLFIPTTPNPTTGWYVIVAENEVIDTDMSVEDAFKVLISGGIVAPHGPGGSNRSASAAKATPDKAGSSHNDTVHSSRSNGSSTGSSTGSAHSEPIHTSSPETFPSNPSTEPHGAEGVASAALEIAALDCSSLNHAAPSHPAPSETHPPSHPCSPNVNPAALPANLPYSSWANSPTAPSTSPMTPP